MNPDPPPSGSRRTALLIVLLIALAIRLGWGMTRPADAASIELLPDQREYLDLARSLLHGQGLRFVDPRFGSAVYAFRLPGYPLFLAACGADVRVARAAQALIDTLTVLAAYLLARRWLAPGTSLLSAVLVAVNPYLVYFSGLILSETLFTAMLAWGMVLLTRRGSVLDRYIAGLTWVLGTLLIALSIHVRPSALGLAVVLALAGVFANRGAHAAYQRRWPLPAGATALLLTLLVLVPWAYRNWRVLDHWIWTSTNSGFTAYDGFNPDATGASDQRFWRDMPQLSEMNEVERSRYLADRAGEYVRRHPRRVVELAAKKAGRMWSPMPLSQEFGRPLYVAAALAFSLPFDLLVLLGLWRRGGAPATATTGTIATGSLPASAKVFLLMPAVYLTVIHALSVGSLRYRIPAEVPMAVLAAYALAGASRGLKRDRAPDAAGEA